jgi:hypothetical protein
MIMVLAPDKRARQAAASRTANQHRGQRTPEAVEAVEAAPDVEAAEPAQTVPIATAEEG